MARRSRMMAAFAMVCALPGATTAQERAPLPPTLPWSGASEGLIARADDPWITPAERSGFRTTPSYAETSAWLDRLVAASSLLTRETFGTTAEGRALYLIRASKGGDKPIVLIQAGIHSGEIDGKDAGLMLLRDIALHGKDDMLDRVDLVFVPILNADGHERTSPFNRPNQRGPENPGQRSTAQNINLNRDYAKADAPETQAMIRLLRRLDPVLYIDMHVSDGFDHGYDVTYTFAGWGVYTRSRHITDWLNGPFRAGIDPSIRRMGHHPYFYPSAIDERDLSRGLRFAAEGPRYSTGYGDYTRIPTVLVEMHSLKPYRQRVLGAYAMMEAALRQVGLDAPALRTSIAADRADRPTELPVRWQRRDTPLETVPFVGMALERYRSPASGEQEVRYLARPQALRLPLIGQTPVATVRPPRAWWVPVSATDVIARLDLHGIAYTPIDAAQTLDLDMARIVDPVLGPASEGRIMLSGQFHHERRRETMPAGSVRVPYDQDRGLLAAALLEPESVDSLLAWGFFPAMLQKNGGIEGFASAPMADAMLARDPALRAAFEAKLAADPAFAADGEARLAWFVDRSPYRDDRYLLYPVGREVPH
ncbi:carboxypeptidase [Sphingomonas sp. Leaf339]|uniref:M14 family metallopeptidase n=1 Tax=Sphingomonas sp. Leaf339 TaxID=1736343 RepID=UPI0006FFCCF5|nr:M14 family metallopeptidase [Sphingomonas sp. Leaf339]KQU61583.1 carboxypeptidase [Sphingomonas sp. Leaf339]